MADEVYTIEQLKALLVPVFQRNNVRKPIVFGTYGKGEASPNSDIDLFVDSGLRGLDFYGLLEEVVHAVGKDVDLIDASEVVPGSPVDMEIAETGILLYDSLSFESGTQSKPHL